MKTKAQPILKSIASQSIPNGIKFVAFYYDGSGSSLFWTDDDGHLYDTDADELGATPDADLLDAGYGYWMQLPDTFEFWFEQKEEDRT